MLLFSTLCKVIYTTSFYQSFVLHWLIYVVIIVISC